jgi:hypothetical protein
MARRLVWVGLFFVALAGVIAANALNTILRGCDYGPIGIGRPLCEADVGSAWVTVAIASFVVVVSGVSAVVLFRHRTRRPS